MVNIYQILAKLAYAWPILAYAWLVLGLCLAYLGLYLAYAWPTYALPMLGMESHSRDLGMDSHPFLLLLMLEDGKTRFKAHCTQSIA